MTHRAYVLAANCDSPTTIRNPLRAADCDATLTALETLGSQVEVVSEYVRVCGPIPVEGPSLEIDAGNSGTTLRLLMGQIALLKRSVTFVGDESLSKRPSEGLILALNALGVCSQMNSRGTLPVTLCGPLAGHEAALGTGESSQYASSLLLALARLGRPGVLRIHKPIHSRPYFEMTLQMAKDFGALFTVVETSDLLEITLSGTGFSTPSLVQVEGDWSSMAFILVAAWALRRTISIVGLNLDSVQADRQIRTILEATESRFTLDESGALMFTPRHGRIPPEIDVRSCPDLFPILCVLAVLGGQSVKIAGAPNLRHKESDRIRLMVNGLQGCGVECDELADGVFLRGGRVRPGKVETARDHRIQMAFRVLAVCSGQSIELDGSGSEGVSYPSFEMDLALLLNLRDDV